MNLAPSPKISLVAIDIDGTLLTGRREIHPENVVAAQEALADGVYLVLASGRIRPSMTPFAAQLGIGSGPFICSNGAHVVGPDGATLAEFTLTTEDRDAVIDFATRNDLHLHAYSTDRMFYLDEDKWSEIYRQRARTIPASLVTPEELGAMNYIKMMVIAEPARIKEILPLAKAEFEARGVALTESEPEYLEFLPNHVSKGSALQLLAEHLGLGAENVAAVGDYLNDLEMVEWAGTGIAMGNAVPHLKQIANKVAPTNDEGGVAWAIRTVIN